MIICGLCYHFSKLRFRSSLTNIACCNVSILYYIKLVYRMCIQLNKQIHNMYIYIYIYIYMCGWLSYLLVRDLWTIEHIYTIIYLSICIYIYIIICIYIYIYIYCIHIIIYIYIYNVYNIIYMYTLLHYWMFDDCMP